MFLIIYPLNVIATRLDANAVKQSCLLESTRRVPQEKFPESQIINLLLTTLFRMRWLNIGLALFCGFMNLGSVHKHASWPHALSITYTYLARSSSQTQARIWFVLPALGAGHIMKKHSFFSTLLVSRHESPPSTASYHTNLQLITWKTP